MSAARRVAPVLCMLAFALPLAALPQLAVLNVILSPGIDPTVVGIITGKIEQPIVESRRYEVLDRSNVDQVLTEKEFQLSSGLVKPEEARQAGEYLGADLVVAGTVSRIGQTYALSAKMIDVATGKVLAQASAEREGKIDVLLDLARLVGQQLAAGGAAGAGPEQASPEQATAASAPPFYQSALLVQAGYIEVGSDDGTMLQAAYFYSLRPKFGLAASGGYVLGGNGSWTVNLGGFFTPFPLLSFGVSGGYARLVGTDELTWSTFEDSCFSVGPVVLLRIKRLALGVDLKFAMPTGTFWVCGGLGVCF